MAPYGCEQLCLNICDGNLYLQFFKIDKSIVITMLISDARGMNTPWPNGVGVSLRGQRSRVRASPGLDFFPFTIFFMKYQLNNDLFIYTLIIAIAYEHNRLIIKFKTMSTVPPWQLDNHTKNVTKTLIYSSKVKTLLINLVVIIKLSKYIISCHLKAVWWQKHFFS